MNIQAIREQRSTVVTEMRALTQMAEQESRDLTDEESGKFDGLRGQLTSLDSKLERAQVIADAERSMAIDPDQPRRGNDGDFDTACRNFSVTKAIAQQLAPSEVDAGRELEISQELARRSGSSPSGILVPHQVFLEKRDVLTSGSGGSLVPEQHRADLMIDRLRASLQVQGLGATMLNGLVGTQDIPRLTGSATGYWVAEHGAVTGSDHTYDDVNLAPKTVGAEVEYSRRMLINAVPSVEQLVRSDLANVLATAIDHAAINADGTGNTPNGILNTSGINSVTFGGAPSWDKVLEFISLVGADNALMGSLGWLTNPHAVKTLRSTVKVASTDSVMLMESAADLAGYPLRQSTNVPGDPTSSPLVDSTVIFGNWSDLLIGYWSSVDILVNPYHSDVYSKGGVKINALQDCDIAVRHPESFAAATDMTH